MMSGFPITKEKSESQVFKIKYIHSQLQHKLIEFNVLSQTLSHLP
jgi:hypothetical protein